MLSLERGRGADLQQSITQLNRELAAASAARDSLSQQFAPCRRRRSVPPPTATRCARSATGWRSSWPMPRCRHARAPRGRSGCSRISRRRPAAPMPRSRRPRQSRTSLPRRDGSLATPRAGSPMPGRSLPRCSARSPNSTRRCRRTRTPSRRSCPTLPKLAQQNRALAALRDTLEKQAQDAAARAMTDQQRRAAVETQLAEEKRLGDSAKAQIALLNQQVDELKAQLTSVAMALALTQMQGQEKDTQIANLGQKLNIALATKVEELQRYRSEFFGKLREVLANRPGIQIVGDRFVFQSEVLFPLGQRRPDAGGPERDHRARHHHQGHREADSARHQMDPARRWPHRSAADQGVSRVRIQLGAVGGARHHRGETADRRWRAAGASRRDGVRRQPAARFRRYAGCIREEPAHRTAADGSSVISVIPANRVQ